MNLDDLFKWKGELEIKDNKGEPVIVVFQRIVGDAQLVTARKQALKASATMRKDLRQEESDSRIAMVPNHDALDDETLCRMVLLSESMDIRSQANTLADMPKEPKELSNDATLEQQEEYEASLVAHTKAIEQAIQDKSKELADKRLKELEGIPRKKLVDIFLATVIDSLCRSEMLKTFNCWCAYLGTYKDKRMKALAFSSYAAFDNASPELKNQVLDRYIELELGGADLKN